MDHFFNATINHNFGRRRLRGGSPTWVDAFLAERGLTIMYTGKGERRDDEKKANDKDNYTGWEQAAACGGGSTKWLDSYLAGGGMGRKGSCFLF